MSPCSTWAAAQFEARRTKIETNSKKKYSNAQNRKTVPKVWCVGKKSKIAFFCYSLLHPMTNA